MSQTLGWALYRIISFHFFQHYFIGRKVPEMLRALPEATQFSGWNYNLCPHTPGSLPLPLLCSCFSVWQTRVLMPSISLLDISCRRTRASAICLAQCQNSDTLCCVHMEATSLCNHPTSHPSVSADTRRLPSSCASHCRDKCSLVTARFSILERVGKSGFASNNIFWTFFSILRVFNSRNSFRWSLWSIKEMI
jgi:hypothetical protein